MLICIRVALPYVLRSVAASQASAALHARVEIGDVDLALWKGGVALEQVAVYPLPRDGAPRMLREGSGEVAVPPRVVREGSGEAVAAPRVLREGTGEAVAAPRVLREGTAAARLIREGTGELDAGGELPIVAFDRFAVELRYWPLFSKTIQLRDIALDGPRVALDRLADGDLNVMALVPQSEVAVEAGASPTPTAAADAEPATPWRFGLDKFVLRHGRLRFRDLALAGSEPVEVGIDQVSVQEIALSPGVYGEPARVDVTLGVDEGEIDVAARFELIEAGVSVTCDVTAQRLPLRRARLYVPKVGWSDLQGELDLALTYTLQSDATNELHGTLALRNVAVAVPQLEDVAAGWKSLEVGIESIDLLAQRAAIASVALNGANLYVRAQGDEPLPVLAQPMPAGAGATPQSAPTPAPEAAAEPSPPPEPAKPWDWSVASLRIDGSTVHILSDQPTQDIEVKLDAANLAGAPDAIAHLALGLGLGAATVNVDGDLRIAAPAFGGTLKITDLSLPPLVAVSGAVDPSLLPTATLASDLAIEAGLPAATGGAAPPPELLRVKGSIGLRDVRVVPPGAELSVEAGGLDLAIEQLTVPGVIPPGHKAGPGAALQLAAKLGLRDTRVASGGEQPLTTTVSAIDLRLSDVAVPAALAGLAPAESPQPLRAALQLDLTSPQVSLGAEPLSVGAAAVHLAVPQLELVALPPDADPAGAPPARVVAQLDVDAAKVTTAEGRQLAVDVQRIGLKLSELTLPGITAGPPAAGAAPLHAVAQLDIGETKVAIGEGKDLSAGVQSITLQLSELTLPGLLGPSPGGDPPLRAAAILSVAQPRAVRGDGKEFSFTAKSIAVPLGELVVTAAPAAGGSQSVQAAFGDVRIDGPVARLTRTKEGMVLPSGPQSAAAPAAADAAAPPAGTPVATAAPAAPPAAGGTPPLQVSVASLRISKGDLDFTDRAVQPAFHDRYKPINLEARNLRFPNLTVKPLKLDITSAEQGRITATGEFGPQGGALDLLVDKFPLTPFNPYATTYSPYSIGDGALTLKTTVKLRGQKYDVNNAITFHQLDLGGVEGNTQFEQQYGIPLNMALALLRDTAGDIDLNVPVEVDQSGGAAVDLAAVVRTALRQALFGAIQSPLKLVGGIIGVGGKGGSIAPAPIAFPLGRSAPTAAGADGARRLAAFLAGRPTMAAQLDAEVTPADVRWLHEQSLRGQWAEEGFFQRTFAFVTERGPRERIGSYLTARAEGQQPQLSAEDAATLQQWLNEQPPPSPEQLRGLAEERVAAVTTILRDKGIDAARIGAGEPSAPPAEAENDAAGSPPVVTITFKAMDEPDDTAEPPAAGIQ